MLRMADIPKEIAALKSAAASCKVIRRVGDFDYVITAGIADTAVTVKFQLTGDYPATPAVTFIRGITKDQQNRIAYELREARLSLVEYYTAVTEFIRQHGEPATMQVQDVSPTSRRKSAKSQGAAALDADAVSSKKPPMRTAADVVKRVQWDAALDQEKFVVGYVDRFLGVQEQPFTAFNWVNPAEADWMDLNIPEHRIEYFKYDGTVVWEKQSRTDNVFGSTGGKTIDTLLSETSAEPVAGETEPSVDAKASADSSEGESDEEEDGVRVTVGTVTANPLANIRQQRAAREKPNHFIALPITSAAAVSGLERVKAACLAYTGGDNSRISEHLVDSQNLHVTLCALRIDDENDLDMVSQCLYDEVTECSAALTAPLRIAGLGHFWSRVLYARVEPDDALAGLVAGLRGRLSECGIRLFDEVAFVPHVTVLKFYQTSRVDFSVEGFIAKHAPEFETIGEQTTEQLHLLSMSRDDSGRYVSAFCVDV